MLLRLLDGARKALGDFAAWLDPHTDRGDGPLQRCQVCGEARHDIDEDGYCWPCFRVAI